MRSRTCPIALLALLALACRTNAPDFTTGLGSNGPPPGTSSSSGSGTNGSSTSGSGSGSDSGEISTSASSNASSSSSTGFLGDVGSDIDLGDSGDDTPVGCQGKIDFLFIISSDGLLKVVQEQMVAALPGFIDTIASKFDDFDYHIMVVDADDTWGTAPCTAVCPDLSCLNGEPCCSKQVPADGDFCCSIPDYPCDYLDLVGECESMIGAGIVLPVGIGGSNKPCKIKGGHRYITKGQPNLAETFQCIAKVGLGGASKVGDALVFAVSPGYNGPLGCNTGFLRDDALLMVTMITPGFDVSSMFKGHEKWHERLLTAKHGDPKSIVMLLIGRDPGPCIPFDEPCQLAQMLPYNLAEDSDAKDYGPAFDKATDMIETACEQLIPQ